MSTRKLPNIHQLREELRTWQTHFEDWAKLNLIEPSEATERFAKKAYALCRAADILDAAFLVGSAEDLAMGCMGPEERAKPRGES